MPPALIVLPLSLFLLGTAGSASRPPAYFRCDAPASNPWLTGAPQGFRDAPPLDESHIQAVPTAVVDEAVARLRDGVVHALTAAEAAELTGAPAPAGVEALRPWLVRAVYPVESPHLSASWLDGGKLVVIADGLGCAPYVKHPLVLWLEREPSQVFVVATAAL